MLPISLLRIEGSIITIMTSGFLLNNIVLYFWCIPGHARLSMISFHSVSTKTQTISIISIMYRV